MFNKKDPVFITKVCLIIVCGAFLYSFISASFNPRAQAQVSSVGSPSGNTQDIIPGSENIPQVSLGNFFQNIVETTGVFAFIMGSEEGGVPRVEETPSGEPITIFGWMDLLMILVGFGLIYLGSAKKF